ncbi:ATP-dependent DNA helicase Rep [Fusobacterium sp. DD29]|uniref:ATP-dependent helicase n=1 Tax=unclassified Fusobacterium TaxID=2648384 RepID=UPI001D76F22E|nr:MULTISPECIES: ATP-dependent helicase [unclassified Fusobacterium]MBR8701066.1 ATP-dependent DNA helicase Rep [Fusobacterium sp. DD45]MBR8710872.1 ATP-dependent DNA helicase Rep [Fusobacterium sp. DD28]MBR8749084.1 ATP-dependent DNA helicase Rep [Fusobacterium sp. DD29]MBR8751452.1 ATP-dependent DNA helicase Rep [Fusobacterium sp. DD26]MBR8761350.1 ATP-dependent DNA helicase Rep [Fusobacterium sp. DD25]
MGISPEVQLKKIVSKLEKREVKYEKNNLIGNLKIDYSKVLSKEQQIALHCLKGQYLVIAGAGSGKTRTMVYRTAYLIENGVLPSQILMITFTRKAAEEMRERLLGILETKETKVRIMTFHSLCAKIIFKNKALFNIEEMHILGDDQKREIIETLFHEEKIGNLKIALKDVEEYIEAKELNREILIDSKQKEVSQSIYEKFTSKKEENNLYEFEDLIRKVNEKFMENRNFLEYIQRGIEYLIVDEYQDSNDEQRRLLKLLVGKEKNLMVVGDDFQSIYGFRGADFTNILKFGKDFPNSKLIKLQTNYRSKEEIINYTNKISKSMKIKYNKKVIGTGNSGGRIFKNQFINEEKQWEYLCKKIMNLHLSGTSYSEIAILYRNRYGVKGLLKYLTSNGIPYHTKSDESSDGVALLSVHSSKGLEWDVVFLPTMMEGIFPSFNNEEELEEEKRLYYVGCSRAKTNLYLLYPKFYYEKTGYYEKKSRFLNY